MTLKYNKLYYGTHVDKPSIFWCTQEYCYGYTTLFSSVTDQQKSRASICIDKQQFLVTRLDKNTVLLFFPELKITVKEKMYFLNEFVNINEYYKNYNDLWNKLNA